MTALAVPTVAGPVTFTRVVRSEWTKFRSLRSSWWGLAVSFAAVVLFGLVAASDAAGNPGGSPADLARASQFGVLLAQLAVLVVAALFVTGEYGTGMIRSTMTAVPRRTPALLAKAAVLVGLLLPLTMAASLLSFALTDAVFVSQGKSGASLGDPGVLSTVLGGSLYLTVAAVFALGVGSLLRNTAAAVSTVAGIFFVLPAVAFAAAPLRPLAPYLPSNAGGALSRAVLLEDPLPGWTGFALFCAYTGALLLAANARLRRRDV